MSGGGVMGDCGPEDEIRDTELADSVEYDAEAEAEQRDEIDALFLDSDECRMIDEANSRIERGGYTEYDAAILRIPKISEDLILCGEQGLAFCSDSVTGYGLLFEYDESTHLSTFSDVGMKAVTVNIFGDDRNVGKNVGLLISLLDGTNDSELTITEAIFLPKDDSSAQQLIGAAKLLLLSGEPKKVSDAANLLEQLKAYATRSGVNVTEALTSLREEY